jgi:hypothetical protein
MPTAESEQSLHKVLDLTRAASLFLLAIHWYLGCFPAFRSWKMSSPRCSQIILRLVRTKPLGEPLAWKIGAFVLLLISLLGAAGRKSLNLQPRLALACWLAGLALFFGNSPQAAWLGDIPADALLYIGSTSLGYLLCLTGGLLFSRIIRGWNSPEVFNRFNESFPQEERLLKTPYSINLRAKYEFHGKIRKSWINIVNPFRGVLVLGSPGSGKSYFIIRQMIRQLIQKGFSLCLYDFKFDELSRFTYANFLKYQSAYRVRPQFFVIDLDDLRVSRRCNPLHPQDMEDISDAAESARTLLLGLNRTWIRRQGDFFVESPINLVTALIWFLKKYEGGKYCTLAHVIELAQVPYHKLFTALRAEPQIEALIHPFISAYLRGANEQLEGQVASASISLARLSFPALYYILSGNDFTLDIGHPQEPKILCIGNNPQKAQTYGAVISLYLTALARKLNRKGNRPTSLILDEFPTVFVHGMDNLMATARSNRIAAVLAAQDASQLRFHYGREQADVIQSLAGNLLAGQASGETARQLCERMGKTMQDRKSFSVHGHDSSVTYSSQLDAAIPASRIASLSAGEFVGMVADSPGSRISLKAFCAEILPDPSEMDEDQQGSVALPLVSAVGPADVMEHFLRIKEESRDIIDQVIGRMTETPEMEGLILHKK